MTGLSGAIEAGHAFVRLSLQGRAKVEAGLRKLGARMKVFAKSVAKMSIALTAAAAAASVPLVMAASQMEETMNRFNVVFADASKSVKKWSDETAAAFGRPKQQLADFLAGAQDLLVPMGVSADKATELSKVMSVLAVDLGSFTNRADGDVFRDLQSAITGSGEVMKKYGVVLSEATLKQELMKQGLDPKNATDAEKAQARLAIVIQNTSAAQGDAIRSADSFANQLKATKSKTMDLAVAMGGKLLPFVSKALDEFSIFMDVLGEGNEILGELGKNTGISASMTGVLAAAGGVARSAFEILSRAVNRLVESLINLKANWHKFQAMIAKNNPLASEGAEAKHMAAFNREAKKAAEFKKKFGMTDKSFTEALAAKDKRLRDDRKEAREQNMKDMKALLAGGLNVEKDPTLRGGFGNIFSGIGKSAAESARATAGSFGKGAADTINSLRPQAEKSRFMLGAISANTGGRLADTFAAGSSNSPQEKTNTLLGDIKDVITDKLEDVKSELRNNGLAMR